MWGGEYSVEETLTEYRDGTGRIMVLDRLSRGSIGFERASNGQDIAAVTPRAACRVEQLATGLVFSTRSTGLASLGTLSRRTCCRWVVVEWDGTRDVHIRRIFAGTPHTRMNNETYEGARRKTVLYITG